MGVKEEVLRTLRTNSEEYISGQALADGLGVSRQLFGRRSMACVTRATKSKPSHTKDIVFPMHLTL